MDIWQVVSFMSAWTERPQETHRRAPLIRPEREADPAQDYHRGSLLRGTCRWRCIMIGWLRRSRDGGACVVAAGMLVGCSLWPAATGAQITAARHARRGAPRAVVEWAGFAGNARRRAW